MNKLQKEMSRIIEQAFESGKTILVWYDKDCSLRDLILDVVPSDVIFVKFTGSYLRIRSQIDGEDPELERKWLVYIPEAPQEPSWIRDYETIVGSKVEYSLLELLLRQPGLKIKQEVRQALSGQSARELARNWNEVVDDQKPLSEEVLVNALLSTAFGLGKLFTIGRAVIKYVSQADYYARELDRLGLQHIFSEVVGRELGLELPGEEQIWAERIASAILLSELVVKSGGLGAKEFQALLPSEDKRSLWAQIADEWANDNSLKQEFVEWSEKLAKSYKIRDKLAGFENLLRVQSFSEVDRFLLGEIFARLSPDNPSALSANAQTILKVAEERRKSIWASLGHSKYWDVVATALHLFIQSNKALASMQQFSKVDASAYMKEYLSEEGWWKLDKLYLELAKEDVIDQRIQSLFVEPAILAYADWLNRLTIYFAEASSKLTSWPPPNFSRQLDFWETIQQVKGRKMAIFFVDALRYDLCRLLKEELERSGSSVEIHPMIALLPSITEVGMGSLLPRDGRRLTLDVKKGRLHVLLDGTIEVTSRSQRMNWLTSSSECKIRVVDLDELIRMKADDTMKLVSDFDRIIVTYREIDEAGTFLTKVSVQFFEDLVKRTAKGAKKLHEAGIKNVVLTTDHGFLMLPNASKISLVDATGPEDDIARGRRYIVGKAPREADLVEFPLSAEGLEGDGIVATTRGLSMFPIQGEVPRFVHGGLSPQEVCLAYLVSTYERAAKADIRASIPDVISTTIFFVEISPREYTIDMEPRRIIVKIMSGSEQVGESEVIDVYNEPKKVQLKLRKIVPSVSILVIDAETEETLYSKKVDVKLSGYDELL